MELKELEGLLPEIESREKTQEGQRKAREDKLKLLHRACYMGLIQPPVRGKHFWSEKVCPKCGGGFRGGFVFIDDRQHVYWRCRSESCGYEYIS